MTISAPPITVKPVSTAVEQEQFLDIPARVYANDPNWVPPIRADVAKQFQLSNPFFEYGKLQQFIAYQDGQPMGRIVAAVNQRLIEREGANVGLFGFFECVDRVAIATQLFHTASQWLKGAGHDPHPWPH